MNAILRSTDFQAPTALMIFIFNGIGLSLGPTLFAVLTDKVFNDPALLWRSLAFAAPFICLAGRATLNGRPASVPPLCCR